MMREEERVEGVFENGFSDEGEGSDEIEVQPVPTPQRRKNKSRSLSSGAVRGEGEKILSHTPPATPSSTAARGQVL